MSDEKAGEVETIPPMPASYECPPIAEPSCPPPEYTEKWTDGSEVPYIKVEEPELPVPKTIEFRDKPVSMTCPKCNKQMETKVKSSPSKQNHAAAWGCAVLDGGILSVPLAYSDKSKYNHKHTCSCCYAHLGTYQKFQQDKNDKKAKKEQEKQAKKDKKEQEKQAKKDKKAEKKHKKSGSR